MRPIRSLFTPEAGASADVGWYLGAGGLRRRLLVLARSARALSQLHGKGYAYSDPSPVNIFISEDPAFTEIRFIDTDNLRISSSPGAGGGVYTPGFGAPELVQGKSGVTTLTDIHAFAVIAHQVLRLAHPFIGDLVNDGEPELEEQAFAGGLPWIDDAGDDSNRAGFGVPRDWVLSEGLKRTYEATFGAGRLDPSKRPGAAEWADRLFDAADATVRCPKCKGDFYFNRSRCCWCDAERPAFATVQIRLWDPENGDGGGIVSRRTERGIRPVIMGHGALTSAGRLTVARRQAFGGMGPDAEEPVIEATLDGDRIHLRSLDGNAYRLASPTGQRDVQISDRPKHIKIAAGEQSWSLHFGEPARRHRVLDFALHPGRKA
jgi:hypothetical protein